MEEIKVENSLNSFDILTSGYVKINQQYLINLTKSNHENIDEKEISKCKIIKFGFEWKYYEILKEIERIDLNKFKNLFILILELKNIENEKNLESESKSKSVDELLRKLSEKFDEFRPLVLQFKTEEENFAKFYFKEENHLELMKIDINDIKSEDFGDFQTFLCLYLKAHTSILEKFITKSLKEIINSSLILRFCRVLDLTKEHFQKILVKCTAEGSVNDLQAILDTPIVNKEEAISCKKIQNVMSRQFEEIYWILNTDKSDKKALKESHSILSIAVTNSNTKVCTFIVKNFQNSIEKLPKNHQLLISSAAFQLELFDLLSILVKSCNFPFPDDISIKNGIVEENDIKIFNDSIKFNDIISKVKLKVNDAKNSILLMAQNSFIHKRVNKIIKPEYWSKIIDWYDDLYSIEAIRPILNIAASCEGLKIIYDFDSETVDCVDISSTGSLGIIYYFRKLIIIGAEFLHDSKREDVIKGTLAHEICHFVMYVNYENDKKPYFKHDKASEKEFTTITDEINLWPSGDPRNPDDECDGIISTVFTEYEKEEYRVSEKQ